MNAPLRLVLFDVDGTLVDSQGSIVGSATCAFDAVGLPVPDRSEILSIVGLSLPQAFQKLAPDQPEHVNRQLVDAYKEAYHDQRLNLGAAHSPLYPGTREILEQLHGIPEVLMGVATGKSRRGLDGLIEAHGLEKFFVTRQVADDHPSKPHPSMIQTALSDTGVDAEQAVMVGDTQFDMQMAQSAGVASVGVSWGYHSVEALHQATSVIDTFEDLPPALARIWD